MSKIQYVLIALAAAVVILAAGSIYTVNQGEQALVLQFGRPVRVVKEPGLKLKIPMIQNVVFYDARLLNLDPPAQEVVLNDKKRLDVDSFTRYRIIDPLKFYKTVRTEYQAQSKLAEIVNSSIRKILGRSTLQELLSQKRTQIMNDISAAVKVDAEQIGVSVADVRIRRADLPLEVLQAINARMKTEREREAKEFRAQGSQEAQKIKASADKEKTIILADAEMCERRMDKAQKAAKGDKKFLHEVDVFKALAEHLDAGKSARTFDCSDDDKALIATSDLLTLKPIIYAANMDEDGFANQEGNEYLKKVRALAEAEGSEVLPICAKLEQDIAELEGEEKQMFLDELGIAESGLDRLIKCSYSLLGLISFLTYGKDECRAWTIKKGTKAPQAAGKIHSDFERGFIRAEVVSYEDLMACGTMAAAREKGLIRSEGKEYVVQDGDIILFRFNV